MTDGRGKARKAPLNWFESFFAGLAVEFWRVVVPEQATAEEAAFLWKHLGLSPGARVLDVPCGHGRLSVPLAAMGCALTGVDLSREFLKAARDGGGRSGAPRGGSIVWHRADMRTLPWRGSFDAAFCMGNSFGYLDDAGNAAFLAAVARALVPRGRFVLDFGQCAESIFPRLEPHLEVEMGGFRFAEETRYDIPAARIENVYTIEKDGKSERKLASQRVYLASDLWRLLEEAGFEVLEAFGSSGEEPYALGAQRLLTVARKRAVGEKLGSRLARKRKTPLTPTLSRRERGKRAHGAKRQKRKSS
ncbi:MAG TPA: class I SAM-dependent methyltransferase [Thermoanaerobaculia bacterium]